MPPLEVNQNLFYELKQSNESALEAIYEQFWKPLFISAFNILKDKETCEDIIQNVFTTLWIKREQLEIHTSLKAYLYMAVRYRVYTHIRNGKRVKEVISKFDEVSLSPTPESDLLHKELQNQINRIIEQLPDRCRLIYKMSREQQMPHQEIANKLNLSRKTVENQITIALRKIREVLATLFSVFIHLALLHTL